MLSFHEICQINKQINKGLNQHKNHKHSVKRALNL